MKTTAPERPPLTGLVLAFNTCGPVHLAAQVHKANCERVRAANKVATASRGYRRGKVMVEAATWEGVVDLNERGWPVRFCPCTGLAKDGSKK